MTPAAKAHAAERAKRASSRAPRWCRHALEQTDCPVCGENPRTVYIAGGGTTFHLRKDCPSLVKGQTKVERRGGVTSPITAVGRKAASQVEFRDPCRTCVKKPLEERK